MTNEILSVKTKETGSNSGVEREDRLELAKQMGVVLANSYSLYVETQGVHWNIMGPLFYSVHKLTEEQYEDLASAIDQIAERIRALGFKAPSGFKNMQDLSSIDSNIDYDSAHEMLTALIEDNEKISVQMRAVIATAERYDDVKTADLLTERIGRHEQNAWMLRAIIAE